MWRVSRNRGYALIFVMLCLFVISAVMTQLARTSFDHARSVTHYAAMQRVNEQLDNQIYKLILTKAYDSETLSESASEKEIVSRLTNIDTASDDRHICLSWENDGRDNDGDGSIDTAKERGLYTIYVVASAAGIVKVAAVDISTHSNDTSRAEIVRWREWNPLTKSSD